MKKYHLPLIVIAIMTIVSSCKKNDNNKDNTILNPNTVIVDLERGSYLTLYDTTRLGFNSGASVTEEIEIGSIVVSGPQTLAPDGFLRRILSVDTIGGIIVYTTEHAKFTDALEQAEFNVTSTFDLSEVIPLDSSVTITALKKEAETFQFLIQVDLKDHANNAFTVDLAVNLEPSFELECKIRGGIYVSALLNMDGDWEIKGTASTELVPFQFKKPLFKPKNIARQTILVPPPVGIFPVVLNEDFVVYLVGQVSIDGSITLGVKAEFESTLGVQYVNEQFNEIRQFDSGTPQYSVSSEVIAEGRLGIWPTVIVSAYDQHLGKIEIGPEGYLETTVSLSTNSQTCRLDYGVDLKIAFSAPIFTNKTWNPTLPPIYGPQLLLSNFCGDGCLGFSASTSVNVNTITANPTGGTAPYSYSWSNGKTTKTISGLSNGTYTVTASDDKGCTATASGTVGVDPCQSSTLSVTANVSGSSITADVNGGTSPYSYSWSNGSNSSTISGLSAGTYTVIVTDDDGCTATDAGTISASGSPDISINDTEIDDDNSGGSNGNDDGVADAGETIELKVQIVNNGNATATNITAELSTNDTDITITDDSENYGDLTVGATDWNTDFDFEIDVNCPTKNVQFTLTIASTEGSWTRNFSLPINGGQPQFPKIVYNSSNVNIFVRTSRDSTLNNEITSIAPGKKVIATSKINGWYSIDIPYDGTGSPKEGWAFGGPGHMQSTSGNCVKVTDTDVIVFRTPGAISHANVLWIDDASSSSGNPEWLSTDIDQHYVYSLPTQQYGGYTWYQIDLPNFCNDNNGTQTTIGWISGEYSEIGNCF